MKRELLIVLTCFLIVNLPTSAKIKEPKRQKSGKDTLVEIKQLPGRNIISLYASVKEMTADTAYHSPWLPANSTLRLPLNGMWKSLSSSSDGKKLKTFYKAMYDVSTWNAALFSETDYLLDPNDGNTTRYYRRTVEVPSQWKNRTTYLHFVGLNGKVNVWLNGKKAGSVQGNGNDEELDVTSCIRTGSENIIALELHDKKHMGENARKQLSMMYSSHRNIYLEARPSVYVQNIQAETYFNEDMSVATVVVNVLLRNLTGKMATATPIAYILNPDGTQEEKASTAEVLFSKKKTAELAKLKILVLNPTLWTAETPYLYTLNVKLGDDIFTQQYAIRRMEKRGEAVYLNNHPLILRCVDVSEAVVSDGKSSLERKMESEVNSIKELGVNAICTSPESCDTRLYALCDYYGLYVLNSSVDGKNFDVSAIRDKTQHANVRKECQDVTFNWNSKGSLIVENNYSFSRLKNFRIFFTATQKTKGSNSSGDIIMQGYQDLPDVQPGKSIAIPFPLPSSNEKETTTMNIRLQQKVTTRWTEAGKDVFSDTIIIK